MDDLVTSKADDEVADGLSRKHEMHQEWFVLVYKTTQTFDIERVRMRGNAL